MKVIALALFLLILQPAMGQYDLSGLDPFLQRNQKALGGSLVAVVWKDGKVVYQREAGDFTAKTQAPIASSSKWLTAAMVMSVIEQGKLSLDDPVGKYIPIFNTYMKRYVTIRHCLSHTTGIERESRLVTKIMERRKYQSLEEEVNAIAAKEISNNPGVEFFYGGYGLNIAARVCEIVTKKSYERLMQERITRPLKMRATSFADDQGMSPNPSGGAQSTANDYLNFLIMMLNRGSFEGKPVLSEASVKEMERSQMANLPVKYAPPSASGFAYGLGAWIVEQDAQGNSVVMACPGLFGTWPYYDRCRKYVAILFVKNLQTEQRAAIAQEFRGIIEDALGACK